MAQAQHIQIIRIFIGFGKGDRQLMDDLMNAELNDIIKQQDDIIIAPSGGGNLDVVGDEFHEFIMPDGSKVLIDRFGNIIR